MEIQCLEVLGNVWDLGGGGGREGIQRKLKEREGRVTDCQMKIFLPLVRENFLFENSSYWGYLKI